MTLNSYLLKINSPGVLNIVNRNREIFEPASVIVDHYWVQMQNCSKTEDRLLFTATRESAYTEPTNSAESDKIGFLTETPQPDSVDVDSLVNSLNVKQCAVFNVLTGWTREKVKHSNSI